MTPDYPSEEEQAEVYEYLIARSVPGDGGCIEWHPGRARTEDGYGRAWWRGQDWRVHRLAYHYLVGFLPKSSVVHHTCTNRACWRPDHLQAVSHHDNVAEMLGRVYYQEEIAVLNDEIERLNALIDELMGETDE